jgi:flagellar secretion chaperone FliS
MISQQQNKYLENTVHTATPAQLLIMLYGGAIRNTKMGIEAIRQNQFDDANNYLYKAQDIIKEFMSTLDHTSPIADGLMQLYEYFIFQLIEANTKKETGPAEEVVAFLTDLKNTWIEAAKLGAAQTPGLKHG